MLPVPYELADLILDERRTQAEYDRRCRLLRAAKRWERKAELTARRARLARDAVW
jgi:hypothetical protein